MQNSARSFVEWLASYKQSGERKFVGGVIPFMPVEEKMDFATEPEPWIVAELKKEFGIANPKLVQSQNKRFTPYWEQTRKCKHGQTASFN